MVSNEDVKLRLMAQTGVKFVEVTGDGRHYNLVIVADQFEGKSTLTRQQWVYAQLNDWIVSDQMHALNMKTWTSVEWERQNG
jgi:acid stress-induced BolA-like protein IbaG/YrbA